MMRQWIALMLAMLTTTFAFGNATWPLPDNVRPQTAAQTWTNNNPKVDFSGKGQIRGATDGIFIGYGNNNKLDGNHNNACDDGRCQVDTSLRLSQKPDFSTPNGATSINLKDRDGTLSGGIYQASGEVLLKSGNTLIVTAPSTLYANKFTLDGGRIDVKSGNPDDLIIVTTGDSELINGGTVEAHILSEKYLLLKRTKVSGTLSSNKLKIDEGGLIGGQLPDLPDLDLCQYFPQPIQSWTSGSSLNMSNPNKISGWSPKYVSEHLKDGKLKIGYDSVSYHAGLSGACDVGACAPGGEKVATPFVPSPNFSSVKDLDISQYNYKQQCDGVYCSYQDNGNNQVTITILSNLRALSVNGYNNISFVVRFNDLGGLYGTEVKSYSSGGKVETYFSAKGRYAFGSMSFNGGAISVEKEVTLFLTQSFSQSNAVDMRDVAGGRDLIIYGPNASVAFSTNTGDIFAQILADSVTFNNSITIRGAVTTNKLTMSTTNSHIVGEGACLNPPTTNSYIIELTPIQDVALTCEVLDAQIRVMNQDGTLATDFTGTVTVEQTNGTSQILTPESGVLDQSIALSSDTVMTKKVTAYITDNRMQTEVEAQYKFVPYRLALSPNPLSVIAGKAEDITVRPLECSDSGRPISSVEFEGERKGLTLSGTTYHQPSIPKNSAPIELRERNREGAWVSAPSNKLVLEFNKVNGEIVAVTQLRYAEAGEVSLTLTDKECIEDTEGNLKCKEYGGSQTVLSRPWTFAICDALEAPKLESGSSTSGSGFVAAGESFSTLIKPIAWQGSDGQQEPDQQIETTQALCDSAIVTQNFSVESAPNATVSLAAQLASPNGGAPGHFTDTSIAHYPSNIDGGVYQLDDLSWSEVGSLKLYTSATEYLGQKINIGYRHVGRFYPAYFSIDKTKWHVPSNQGVVAYLGQPYEDVEVEVYPYNAEGQKVRNYSLFSLMYQAQFALEGAYKDRILGFDTDDAWKDDGINSAVWQPELNSVIFSRKADGTTATKEDGPFNTNDLWSTETDFKLTLSGLDPVSFANDEVLLEAELAEQPPARYGRMTLSDVGGATTADIRVPLRVEYFDGRRFVINEEDNATEFDSGLQCILSGTDTSAAFSGAVNQVEEGISQQLFVSRDVSDRERLEQVRLFLRQGDEVGANPNDVECNGHFTQPWLQYNWRSKGDEDPSAMITFGTYRGNDKIIFRGERGLTGR